MKKSNFNVQVNPRLLAVAALLLLMTGGYINMKKKNRADEAAKLPFYNVELSTVPDGQYPGKTYTSFLHLQLNVIVENQQLKDIQVVENDGLDGETARPIINRMIEANKTVVPAIQGAELGSLVYISCVDSALHEGIENESTEISESAKEN